jgi:hypothetical protein
MFIGSEYKLREDREAASETTLGHKIIVIMERVLSHTENAIGGVPIIERPPTTTP